MNKSVAVACLVFVGLCLSGPSWGSGWTDGFDHSAFVSLFWQEVRAIRIEPESGVGGSGAVTGTADDQGYGSMWRRAPVGKSVEVTARIKVASATQWSGVVVGLSVAAQAADDGNPLTSKYPPAPDLTGNYVAVRVVQPRGEENANYAQLQLTYSNPYCGQSLPFRRGKLALDTWYDVKLQVWPTDNVYLASAWYRPSGTDIWTPLQDIWPGKRHVVAYEGFEPRYVALTVSQGVFVDDVSTRAVQPPAPPRLPRPKRINDHRFTILSYGWTTPDTKFLHDNVAEIEKVPFDGWATYAANPRLPKGRACSGTGKGDLGWEVFQNKRATRDLIEPAINDLKSTQFTRLRSNYIAIVSYLGSGTMDWFDDAWWGNIAENARLQAMLAREGGCEGILFDPEEYGCAFWGWPALSQDPRYQGRTYEQTRAKVRQRGREFARALNAAYPGIRILSLHAWDTAMRYATTRWVTKDRLHEVGYGLLPAFLDGILEGSDDRTIIIDGVENTYWVDALPDFIDKARRVKTEGSKLSDVPDLFKRKVRVGFAIWLDRDHTAQPWNSSNSEKNHWTPHRLALVVGNALAAGDGFVWIYSETATWLLDSEDGKDIDFGSPVRNSPGVMRYVPDAYWYALEKAKQRAEQLTRLYGTGAQQPICSPAASDRRAPGTDPRQNR